MPITRKAAAAQAKDTPKSSPPRAASEVIELSSDGISDYGDLVDSDEQEIQDVKAEPAAKTPTRSSKRKSLDEENEPESSESDSKKQKLAVRVKDSEYTEGHRHIEFEIPVARLGASTSAEPSPKMARKAESEPEPEQEPAVTPVVKKGKHIVFGDDDHDHTAEFFTPPEASAHKVERAQEEDEEESDDDAPPEAVSSHHAAAQAEKAAESISKAAEKHSELQKRKRQERDAKFKQQAEVRNAVELKKKKAAAKASPEPELRRIGRKSRKRAMPSVLPAEFLESDSEDGEDMTDDDERDRERRANKKMKFTTVEKQIAHRENRQPQDQVVGSTVYRVLKKAGNERLAPKSHKQSRNERDKLLARRRVVITQKKGFFVK